MKKNRTYLYTIIIISLTCGCTAREFYEEGQGWQRKQCNKMPGQIDSEECLRKTNISYDDYKYKTKTIDK